MLKEVDKKNCSISLFHSKIKHINEIDKTGLLEKKKIEEHDEVLEAVHNVIEAIEHLNEELADKLITCRDRNIFDFRKIRNELLVEYGIFSISEKLICEDTLLKKCHEKADRTISRLESGYYEK